MQQMVLRWGLFLGYLVVMYVIGYYAYLRSTSLSEFYVADSSLGSIPLMGTFIASFVSASSVIGYTSFAYSNGWSLISIYGIGCAAGWALLCLTSAKLRRLEGAATSPDIFAMRYRNESLRTWIAVVFLVWQTLFLIQQFMGIGYVVEQFLGIPYKVGMTIIGVTIIVYVVSGGMRSVVYTDVIQAAIMLVGVFLACFTILSQVGGFSALMTKLAGASGGPSKLPVGGFADALAGGKFTLSYVVINAFSLAATIYCVPFYHRMFFSAKTQKLAKATVGLSTPFLVLFYIALAIIGTGARVLTPDVKAADKIFPILADQVLPPVIGTIVLTCIVAAIMSTVDSLLMACGAMFAHDIWGRLVEKKLSPKREMFITRVGLVAIGGAGLALSFNPPGTIMQMYNVMTAVVSSTLFPGLFVGLYWKRATAAGAFAGSVAGFASSWLWLLYGVKSIPSGLFGIGVGLIVLWVVSLVTRPVPMEQLTNFFEG
ncbi:MAG: sodium:solute symporter family protein [Ignavibacteriales bacterium]